MKYVPRFTGRAVSCLLSVVLVSSLAVANAEIQSGQVLVQAVHGVATYSVSGGKILPVKENLVLTRGATVKTAPDSTVDLILQYNGTVLRLLPGSTLKFDKLNKESVSEGTITETSLNLVSGSILGSQRKLATPSTFEVNIPGGVATIKGTEYVVRADGAVSVISGSVQVTYNLPQNGGSVKVTVTAGNSFNPATGKVVTTDSSYLQNLIADIDTVRQNAKVFKAGGATVVVKPENVLSPTKGHGNNGVGNGQDPQPPGNPPVNDGPGTGPGNPGNRHHDKSKGKN
jgi:hypothetical protein